MVEDNGDPMNPASAAYQGPEPQPDPMVPMLTGWLLGCVARNGRETMKIVETAAEPPDGFVVKFASGLQIRRDDGRGEDMILGHGGSLFVGLPVIVSEHAVHRPWVYPVERFWTYIPSPETERWCRFFGFGHEGPAEPAIYQVDGKLLVHPALLSKVKEACTVRDFTWP